MGYTGRRILAHPVRGRDPVLYPGWSAQAKGDWESPLRRVHPGLAALGLATVGSRRGAGTPSTSPTVCGASISIDNRSLYLAIKTPTPGKPENIDLYATRYEPLDDTGEERVTCGAIPNRSPP